MRLTALHWVHTRRMRKCYGATVAKTKGKSQKGRPASKAKAAPKKPVTAAKKLKATKPSLPLPPPPPAPPPERDEMPAPRDVARLTRYGERFGEKRIDVRWLPLQLPVASGSLAIFDPGAPKSWRVFDR